MRKTVKPVVAAIVTGLFAATSATAFAQAEVEAAKAAPVVDEAPASDEIIVTARKRAESLQDVPVSVTAVNEAMLERNNITRIDQLAQLTPNTMMHSTGILPSEITAYIRGIGDRSAEPSQDLSIAISIDGVYLTNVAGSLVDTFDVQQVEVLRGPQGTLQGRNSPAGAINVQSLRPSGAFGAKAQIGYERFDQISLKGMIEAPLVEDVLAAKISVFRNNGGNFMFNQLAQRRIAGGVDNWGGRLGFLFTPNDKLTAYLSADFIRDKSPDPAIRPRPHADTKPGEIPEPPPLLCTRFGFCSEFPKYENAANLIGRNSSRNGGVGLSVDYDFGPVTLTSITGYRFINQVTDLDNDGVPVTVLHIIDRKTKNRQFSQELRLASSDNGPLNYVVGVYGLHSKFDFGRRTLVGGPIAGLPANVVIPAFGTRSQKTDSYAVFGQASYNITDAWSISGGARHTWDKKRLVATPTTTSGTGRFKASFSQLTVEAGTEYRFSRGNMAYFRFAQGYRAGGINGQASNLAGVNVYDPETVDSYELGLKTESFDRKLTFNVSAFYYDYEKLQVAAQSFVPEINSFLSRLVNANGLKVKGIEFESTFRPSEKLTLTGSLGYLKSDYRSQILNLGTGNLQLADITKDHAPKFTGYFAADYRIPLNGGAGSVTLGGDLSYRSRENVGSVPFISSFQDKFALLNAAITWRSEDENYSLSLFGRNLTNKYYKLNGERGGGIFQWDLVGRPLTYGLRFTAGF